MSPRIALALLMLGASVVPAAAAQTPQDPASAAARGQIDLTYNNSRKAASPAEKTPLQVKGVKLRDMILSTPALANPVGFAVHASVVLQKPVSSRASDPDALWGVALTRRINVSRSKPDAAGRYPGDGEGPSLEYSINRLKSAFGDPDMYGFYKLPDDVREGDGDLRFARSGSDYLVITPLGQRAYQPVSIGEYVNASLREYEGYPQIIADLKGALARLSPAEQAAPYCMTNQKPDDDLRNRCRHPSARRMVKANPALSVGTGANSKARLIVLKVMQTGRLGDQQERARLRTAAGQLDVAAIRGLLSN